MRHPSQLHLTSAPDNRKKEKGRGGGGDAAMRNSASAATVQENRPRITGRQATTRASVPLLLTWPASALAALIVLSGGNARSSARVDGRPVGTTAQEGLHRRLSKITAAGTSPPIPGFIQGEGRSFRPRLVTQRANEERVPILTRPPIVAGKTQPANRRCLPLARIPERTRGCSSISESTYRIGQICIVLSLPNLSEILGLQIGNTRARIPTTSSQQFAAV